MKRFIPYVVAVALLSAVIGFSIRNAESAGYADQSLPTVNAFDPEGTSLYANTFVTGSITLGVEVQADTLDLDLGFTPSYFECWVSATDSASTAKRFRWFTGMQDGTCYGPGITASDSLIGVGGFTPLAAAATDTVARFNTLVTAAALTAAQDSFSISSAVTGIRIGGSVLVDSLMQYYAIP